MSKELPYFRFTVQEWQNGEIVAQSDSAQGVFVNILCYYWANNCEVSEERLKKRFKTKTKTIQKLIKSGTIKRQNGFISISFLDQQLSELNKTNSFFSDMGKLGQKVKKSKAPLEPPLSDGLSYKDKDKDNISHKHFFSKSPFFKKETFSKELRTKNWSSEKIDHYYLSAREYSEANGAKYLDWIKAVMAWDRKNPWNKEKIMGQTI